MSNLEGLLFTPISPPAIKFLPLKLFVLSDVGNFFHHPPCPPILPIPVSELDNVMSSNFRTQLTIVYLSHWRSEYVVYYGSISTVNYETGIN